MIEVFNLRKGNNTAIIEFEHNLFIYINNFLCGIILQIFSS